MQYIIGVDFDNTIAGYDDVIHRVAVRRGLVPSMLPKSKKVIRDAIRRLPDGETRWQEVQAIVYGPKMAEAELIEGVKTFFTVCKEHLIRPCIVSHKTEYARLDITGTNLRKAALDWMASKGFFNGLGLSHRDVYFEPTRREKIERVRRLGCTHFIDDLEETFAEDAFPLQVEKLLFTPHWHPSPLPDVRAFVTWEEINHYLFNGNGRA